MFSFSLLVNSFTLEYLLTTLGHIHVVTTTSTITPVVHQINVTFSLDLQHKDITADVEEGGSSEDSSYSTQSQHEEWIGASQNSFTIHVQRYLDTIKLMSQSVRGTHSNNLYAPGFTNQIVNKWIPTCPFWSCILLGI